MKTQTAKDYSSEPQSDYNGFSERDIFLSGFNHACDIPKYNLDMLKDGMDESEAQDKAFEAWYDAEDNSRQYSPFEFTAKSLNDMPDSEKAWEIFDSGISSAFNHAWDKIVLRQFTFQ